VINMDTSSDYLRKGSTKTIFALTVVFASLFIIVFAGVNEARQDYGLGGETFASLPQMPDNFKEAVAKINATIDFNLGEEYYKQPEFYPTFEQFIPEMKNPPQDRIAIWGVGIYPARHEYVAPRNSQINIVAYLHTSWMVQTYQGAKLEVDYDKQYFDVSVSPDVVLLGPAYPKFDKNWTQKITVKIEVKNAPKGVHEIALNPMAPPIEKIEEWRGRYKGLYVSMPVSSPDQPYLKITVNVV